MKTIFHLHGVIWQGVAEQVCYGKINIMEGLTLLSLSGRDRCVCYWTGYITQTHRHADNLRPSSASLYTVCKHAPTWGTHKDEAHKRQRPIYSYTFLFAVSDVRFVTPGWNTRRMLSWKETIGGGSPSLFVPLFSFFGDAKHPWLSRDVAGAMYSWAHSDERQEQPAVYIAAG